MGKEHSLKSRKCRVPEGIKPRKEGSKVAQLYSTLCDPMDGSLPGSRLPCPWDSPGQGTGMGCHFLLQPRRNMQKEI